MGQMYPADNNREKLLVSLVRKSDEHAFRVLYDRYVSHIYNFTLSLVKSDDHAKEIVQEVFLKVWLTRENLDESKNFKSFIFTIAKNLSLNVLSKAANDLKFRDRIFYNIESSRSTTSDYILNKEYNSIKEKAILSLPDGRRKVFLMSREQGMSYQEISDELGISINTVKTQVKKALEGIREYLAKNSDLDFVVFFLIYFLLD